LFCPSLLGRREAARPGNPSFFAKEMDARVKPAHDGRKTVMQANRDSP
jgi:hypothetical protein